MTEISGDVWELYDKGMWLTVTTNGFVKNDGCAVMGAGIAKQAAARIPNLTYYLGAVISVFGNRVVPFPGRRVISFPVKHAWYEKADLTLIEKSALELRELEDSGYLDTYGSYSVAMVRPGCGNGQLEWEQVRSVIAPILESDRYIIVDNGSGDRSREYHNSQSG